MPISIELIAECLHSTQFLWQKGWGCGAPHLILMMLHNILIFTIEIFSCQSINPT